MHAPHSDSLASPDSPAPDSAAPVRDKPGERSTPPDYLSLFGDAAVLQWGIRMRWIALIVAFSVGLVLTITGAVTWAMYVSVLLLAPIVILYNLAFTALSHLSPLWKDPRWLTALRLAQLPPDLIFVTIGLHLTGGATTPISILYVFFIVMAVVLIPRGGTFLAAGFSTLCYTALVAFEVLVAPPPANLVLAVVPSGTEVVSAYWAHLLSVVGLMWIVALGADRLARRILASEVVIARQLSDLTLLYRVGETLSATPSLGAATQFVVDELGTVLRSDTASLMLIKPNGDAEFIAVRGISETALHTYRQQPLGPQSPLLQGVMAGGSGIFAPDADAVPGLRQVLITPGLHSFYSFPLRAKDKTVAVLNFGFHTRYTMPPATYDLIEACGRQAGLAIERTLLYREAQQAARETASLYRIGLATSASLDIEDVLRRIAEQVQAVIPLDSFVLALYDPGTGLLDFVVRRDAGREYPRESFALESAGAAGWMVQHREPLLVRHWDREVETLPFVPNQVDAHTQSYVGAPLVAHNRVIGVLSAQQREPQAYDEHHLRLLAAIGAQAALALENARLHEATRQQALRDSLTDALNHAALLEAIDRQVTHARVEGGAVSLIMLDIDQFKNYNDRFGHVAGDTVLRAVVQAIRRNVKSTDSIGRWGGEEFGVLLPRATAAEAALVADRIRATLGALTTPSDRPTLPVPTVSQGIACFPHTAAGSAELVDQADRALYHAKAAGRNRVVTWTNTAHGPLRRA